MLTTEPRPQAPFSVEKSYNPNGGKETRKNTSKPAFICTGHPKISSKTSSLSLLGLSMSQVPLTQSGTPEQLAQELFQQPSHE